jgi:hypothetical protein
VGDCRDLDYDTVHNLFYTEITYCEMWRIFRFMTVRESREFSNIYDKNTPELIWTSEGLFQSLLSREAGVARIRKGWCKWRQGRSMSEKLCSAVKAERSFRGFGIVLPNSAYATIVTPCISRCNRHVSVSRLLKKVPVCEGSVCGR